MPTTTINVLARGVADLRTLARHGRVAAATVSDRIGKSIAAYFESHRVLRDIASLDDRLLLDVGVSRYDIPAAGNGRLRRDDAGSNY